VLALILIGIEDSKEDKTDEQEDEDPHLHLRRVRDLSDRLCLHAGAAHTVDNRRRHE
jgi:hypothetical protein